MLHYIKILGYGFGLMFIGMWALFSGLVPDANLLLHVGLRLLAITAGAHFALWAYYRIKYREHYAEVNQFNKSRRERDSHPKLRIYP